MNSATKNTNWQKERILKSKYYQDIAFNTVNNLTFKERKGRKIILTNNQELTEFVSCSYLGLDCNEKVIAACTNNLHQYGVTFPAARTRIKAENFLILEELLNNIFCGFTVVLSSLHLAHLGLIPLIASGEMPSFPLKKNGPMFILDKLVHSSIQINRALMSQFGTVKRVNFSSLDEIEKLAKEAENNHYTPIVFADSIGSMGGINPILALIQLAEKYDGYVYLDDAHGTSVFGKTGGGYVLKVLNECFHPRLILAASLAKAFGSVAGAIVLPTAEDVEIFKEFSPIYVFGGPPAAPVINAAIASAHIHLSEEITFLQEKLQKNLKLFDSFFQNLNNHIINYNQISPIRGLKIGNEIETIKCTYNFRERGIAATAALYPIVAENESVIRLTFSAAHSYDDIQNLCTCIKDITNIR